MPRQAVASLPVNLRPELFCVFDVLLDEGKDCAGVLRGTAEELFHWKGWDLMSKTRILGIVLMVLGVLLLSGAVYQVYVNMAEADVEKHATWIGRQRVDLLDAYRQA